jgi:hypothetical protein
VNKFCRFAALGLIALFAVAAPAFAQPGEGEAPAAPGTTAAVATGQRPLFEFSGAMIIAAALIEGFTFFALFICMQQNPFT